ncbi:MAG: EAL domain-containing protein [Proteobacteria bacterium]|nr:EAL domain-containing protein [Pseudomonadota bacterium]
MRAPSRDGTDAATPLNLMVVNRSTEWCRAVMTAVDDLDAGLLTCGAGEAVKRLARTGTHYTHLLVHERDADGLTGALAELAAEFANPDLDMLLLGCNADIACAHLRVIEAAEPSAVHQALITSPARSRPVLASDAASLAAMLDDAIVEVRYQPIIRISDRRPIGVEALARLCHPALGRLLPDQFMPQIEEAGLAAGFTQRMISRVFADLLGSGLAGTGIRVSVNFPLDVLLCPGTLAWLEQQRAACGIPADRIIVELTESQPVHHPDPVRRSVEHLRALGYGVAIDDVGPAVPHLERLLTLPFTSLKLDKGLVSQAERAPEVLHYLAETVRAAKAHDLKVVAEGVETEAAWTHMRSIGVDHVQGFLAARPLPRTAVPVWLQAWTGATV